VSDRDIPLLIKRPGAAPPDAPAYFVVAANGLHLVRATPLYEACVPARTDVPGLEAERVRLTLRFPPLPSGDVARALGFFREVWARFRGEAIVVLFYAPSDAARPARWRLEPPPQRIRGRFENGRFRAELRLDYEACERPSADFLKLGTMHSHGSLSPAHSATDADDEAFETGLHVTAGYVDSALPAFEAAFVVAGTRFRVPVDRALEWPEEPRPFPRRWLDRIQVVAEHRSRIPDRTSDRRSEERDHGNRHPAR
jgi:hypothetical protein